MCYWVKTRSVFLITDFIRCTDYRLFVDNKLMKHFGIYYIGILYHRYYIGPI